VKRLLLGFLLCVPAVGWSFDLVEAMSAAKERDPQWLAAQARFQQAQEKIPQARAQLLPGLSLSANAMHNQQEIHYPDIDVDQSGAFGTRQAAANLKMPLYQQAAWTGLSKAHQQVEQAQAELASAEGDLCRRLVQAYADVLDARDTLTRSRALQAAYAFELEQAQARFTHGQATIVDADQARAKADQASADVIDASNTLAVNRATLAELIGNLAGDPQPLAVDYQPVPLTPATLSEWQDLALKNSADFRAKTKAVDVAQAEISKQRDAYLPTVDLVGSYTHNGQGNSALMGQTGTVIHQSEIGVQVTMPLYSGGATSSAVRQATAALMQAQDEQEQVHRQLITVITRAYLGVSNGKATIGARKQAVISARAALQSAQKGLLHGKKAQLDVLNAQQQLAGAQKDYTKAELDVLNSEIKLKTFSGFLSNSDLMDWNKLFVSI